MVIRLPCRTSGRCLHTQDAALLPGLTPEPGGTRVSATTISTTAVVQHPWADLRAPGNQ